MLAEIFEVRDLISIIGGGAGLAALIGIVTKFLLDLKKQKTESADSMTNRLEARIAKLEVDNEQCMKEYAALSLKHGEASGKIDGLLAIVKQLQEANQREIRAEAAEATAEIAAAKAEQVIVEAAAKAEQVIVEAAAKAVDAATNPGKVQPVTIVNEKPVAVKIAPK